MNKIYIETSVVELIDKITILEIKKSKISNKEKIVQIEKEYISLIDTTKKSIILKWRISKNIKII